MDFSRLYWIYDCRKADDAHLYYYDTMVNNNEPKYQDFILADRITNKTLLELWTHIAEHKLF